MFGNIARLPGAPAKVALDESTRDIKKPKGRLVTTLLGVLKSQLKERISGFPQSHQYQHKIKSSGGQY